MIFEQVHFVDVQKPAVRALASGRKVFDPGLLARANRGPLSAEGLREIYVELLDLTKREVARDEGA